MTLPVFTALTYLVALANLEPSVWRHDPDRVGDVAVAAEQAQRTVLPRWRHDPRLLGASLVVAIVDESHLSEDVHSGAKRGRLGEVCLVQVHPVNTLWRNWAPSRDYLAGTDQAATLACLGTGLETMLRYDEFCEPVHPYWLRRMWGGYSGGWCNGGKVARQREKETKRVAETDWHATQAHLDVLAAAKKRGFE